MRKFLYLAALSVVATLVFSSGAMAQSAYAPPGSSTVDCSGASEEVNVGTALEISLFFVPDAGGCVVEGGEGTALPPLLIDLGKTVYDPDTVEELGIVKDLDPDLSSGANSVTYQEFCGAFPTLTSLTAQQYHDQTANAKEQTILDPNGDGVACTAEDAAFLAGVTGQAPDDQDQQPIQDQQPQQPAEQQQMQTLPDTGGPSIMLIGAALLMVGGLFRFVALRRH